MPEGHGGRVAAGAGVPGGDGAAAAVAREGAQHGLRRAHRARDGRHVPGAAGVPRAGVPRAGGRVRERDAAPAAPAHAQPQPPRAHGLPPRVHVPPPRRRRRRRAPPPRGTPWRLWGRFYQRGGARRGIGGERDALDRLCRAPAHGGAPGAPRHARPARARVVRRALRAPARAAPRDPRRARVRLPL